MNTAPLSTIGTDRLALTRVEAAKALGVSPATIDRLTARGLLRPSRATRRPLYPLEELRCFLHETTVAIESNGNHFAGKSELERSGAK